MKKILVPGLIAGAVMSLVAAIIGFLAGLLFPQLASEYANGTIFRPWSDPLMSLYFVYPFLLSIILSFVWSKTKTIIKGKSFQDRGVKFALWYFLVGTVSGIFITYSSFQVSLLIVATWTINGLFEAIVVGLIFAKMNP